MSATETDPEVDGNADTDARADEDSGSTETALADLPPSAKLVYKVLEYEQPLTQETVVAESRLCPRTARYALGKLEDAGLVTSRACLEDARQSKYRLAE
ncbi:helix-turn-helix domain-containing protein [Natrinema sp. 1APR25-10V2]|uniref:MarR family transcriptional regulator n=1 Tax=Natrinema sp. 1APR25-10V2 TaxID=2951081 RepID=UPI0028754299|nr:helix-turn-helix domain-containing protein [Natrinema sp. 1APR25-10V2]MDS0475139.1 MarR family transcriptional regulator [Natrinema sp. 1APR25-10V2]